MAPARVAPPARIARSLTTAVFARTLTPTLSLGEGEGDFDTLAPSGGEGQGEGERTTRNAPAEDPT